MSIVPLDEVWVDANFKEVQLRRMRIGQPVKLTADAYGSAVHYDGRIVGLGVGTGGAFALLPAQNATGNWIKVVQRVPVRIAIDPKELSEHPLRVGLSMEVDVNVADTSGTSLAEAPRGGAAYTTNAFKHEADEADALVQRTIAENLGRSLPGAASSPVALAQRTPAAGGGSAHERTRSATARSSRAPL